MSSNRNFGLTFFFLFLIVGVWPLINSGQIRIWSLFLALIFLFLGIINSKLLNPLNKIWYRFGIFLGSIVSPIVMMIIYFFVVTPIGFLIKLLGKDILNKKYNKKKKSYWINRETPIGTMKRQF